jgi:ppGpp synthetase/RelA/SpoT-type nucleotidyltranferase
MKIDQSIRAAYTRQFAIASRLQGAVDKEIRYHKLPGWHYESRIKSEESYALKVECGRAGDPNAAEDFFGCTIVVPNYTAVGAAEDLVRNLYGDPEYRRPVSADVTNKEPSDFRFDDLRLYVSYKDQGFGPSSGLTGTLFEVQVKTFLQHAWSIATHDLIYKSDDVSWRRERVAHQARAALEQTEVIIAGMSALEESAALPATSQRFGLTNAVIAILKENWDRSELPADVRRLAGGVIDVLEKLQLANADSLRELLEVGKARYGGGHNLNWSPYRAIVQYLAEQHGDKFGRTLRKSGRYSIFIYASVLDELNLTSEDAPRATVLGEPDLRSKPS